MQKKLDILTEHKIKSLVGAAFLLIFGVVIVAVLIAGSQAASYQQDFTAWNTSTKATLIKKTATLPKNLYVFDNFSNSEELRGQKQGCAQIKTIHQDIKNAKNDVPTLGFNLMGWTNSAYRSASEQSSSRNKAIDAYLASAEQMYGQISTDCTWNTEFNIAGKEKATYYSLLRTLAMKKGEKQTYKGKTKTCKGESCTPLYPTEFSRYIKAYEAGNKSQAEKQTMKFKQQECFKTSFGKDLCESTYRLWNNSDLAEEAYVRQLKTDGPTVPNFGVKNKLSAARDNERQASKNVDQKMYEQALIKYTGLKNISSFRDDDGSTENVLANIAKLYLRDLMAQQDTLTKAL